MDEALTLLRGGDLADLIRLLSGKRPVTVAGATLPPLQVRHVCQDGLLLREGAEAQSVFVVRSGSFKCVKTLEDGYEQVLFFAQAGDLLGFDALYGGRQPVGVAALEISTAYVLAASELASLRQRCPELQGALNLALSRQLARVSQIAEMMAAVSADARLARFLLWMSQRMVDLGQSPRSLLLRMGRRDIGSLLALAHETVSRSFTTLADAGCIEVRNRDVEIVDLPGLQQRARCTRGLTVASTQRKTARKANDAPVQLVQAVRGNTFGPSSGSGLGASRTQGARTWLDGLGECAVPVP